MGIRSGAPASKEINVGCGGIGHGAQRQPAIAVPVREYRGSTRGEGCLLDERQQQTIQILIREHTPDELGLSFMLWSRPAVTALVERKCGVRCAVGGAHGRQVFEAVAVHAAKAAEQSL